MNRRSAGVHVRVQGVVQGVGYRPWVWQLANCRGIRGSVWNDGRGVVIEAWGEEDVMADFLVALRHQAPPLAAVESVRIDSLSSDCQTPPVGFHILSSNEDEVHTGIAADAATCPACIAEIFDAENRRHRYPFTNCTHCGPRFSIVRAIPWDRGNTSMAAFSMCRRCAREYGNPADRRFHAQPNACPQCGPRVWLETGDEGSGLVAGIDAIKHAASLLEEGRIVAIKGIGGMHLACDAGNEGAVRRLRSRKLRHHKAFALMARDIAMVREHAGVEAIGEAALCSPVAPVVIFPARGRRLAESVAPGQDTLGFMLPYTPLHHLLMAEVNRPLIMTSGNRSDEPQCTENDEARKRLAGIADAFLLHDRDIVTRVDDSVQRVMAGRLRTLRRARGIAPSPLALPEGFRDVPRVLAMGGELKSSFCLLMDGKAVVSQHLGDLEDAASFAEYRRMLMHYIGLYDFVPEVIAVDAHPDYLSTKWGWRLAREKGIPCIEVQHHHAHATACLAETGKAVDSEPAIAVVLDGLGYGSDGMPWGGEFLLADYRESRRLARFHPVALPGGNRAAREPWRNALAHLHACPQWKYWRVRYGKLDLLAFLEQKPLAALERMLEKGINSPLASSAGRLFDAVAAALGIDREQVDFEGQAALRLETLAQRVTEPVSGYPVAREGRELMWPTMWQALLDDLERGTEVALMAARFHRGLADAVSDLAADLCHENGVATVILSGGVFQNRLLLEMVDRQLGEKGLQVLIPEKLPANDGGISLGQAVTAALNNG